MTAPPFPPTRSPPLPHAPAPPSPRRGGLHQAQGAVLSSASGGPPLPCSPSVRSGREGGSSSLPSSRVAAAQPPTSSCPSSPAGTCSGLSQGQTGIGTPSQAHLAGRLVCGFYQGKPNQRADCLSQGRQCCAVTSPRSRTHYLLSETESPVFVLGQLHPQEIPCLAKESLTPKHCPPWSCRKHPVSTLLPCLRDRQVSSSSYWWLPRAPGSAK